MWQTPKIDWTSSDYLNLEMDLNRIEGNIHVIRNWLESQGKPVNLNEKANWSKKDFLLLDDLIRIESNINALIEAANAVQEIQMLPAYYQKNFGLQYAKMNDIEKAIMCLGWIKDGIASLLESNRLEVHDKNNTSIFCQSSANTKVRYQSAYTGQQIDQFIAKMKEWNNGTI